MRVLVIGSGGREHALVWKLSQSKRVKDIYASPGNGGISDLAQIVDIDNKDLHGIVEFVKRESIDLTIVGPEDPLTAGIVDLFRENGLRVFGPSKDASRLEGSKVFAKEFMQEEKIPTADFKVFNDYNQAREYLKEQQFPKVIKADGLCGGKGVFVVESLAEAEDALAKIMDQKIFDTAGDTIIIEECLFGEEASIIAISDGDNIVPLASSQDHKQVYEGDRGPNTGGMGAYSPAPIAEGEIFDKIISDVLRPTILGMKRRGTPFKGVLYAGIMIVDGKPYVLEFNVRFGDPETQAILPRMDVDIVDLLEASIDGRLSGFNMKWKGKSSVSVVLASSGYPSSYEKNKEISGLEDAAAINDVFVFHAGTVKKEDFGGIKYFTAGGRVLNVTALGDNIREAKERAYRAAELISFENIYYRGDISDKALKEEV
ncbi:MAG: phosphoribosylamine--glycine ligase [Candidatus Kaelpia aquatica]|nr:phosphoribosylamine--glycine ligase [Candidatus Kaelpia aquatica]